MRTVVPVLPLLTPSRVHGLKRPQAAQHTPAVGPPAAALSSVVSRVTTVDRHGSLPCAYRILAAQGPADHRPHLLGTFGGRLRRATGFHNGTSSW
ncbi:uncharacterized protein TNCT_378981 [Trichonephila clavata]|uniref:Uncharacterized protein n=1 Tax=Trichonephila clavata TaxID=2740835 RepID=A0A8X6IZE5_TRICU|nr:uncharacterized protein TNCT_657021 [Trichonephila clavata]GFR06574.1 uncharacterized protein TNCT_378981 [Trichonephila clavata]